MVGVAVIITIAIRIITTICLTFLTYTALAQGQFPRSSVASAASRLIQTMPPISSISTCCKVVVLLLLLLLTNIC